MKKNIDNEIKIVSNVTDEKFTDANSKDQKANKKSSGRKTRKPRIEGNNGRNLDANSSRIVIARAKTCPHCGESVNSQSLHGVYDKVEIPEVKPIVT